MLNKEMTNIIIMDKCQVTQMITTVNTSSYHSYIMLR